MISYIILYIILYELTLYVILYVILYYTNIIIMHMIAYVYAISSEIIFWLWYLIIWDMHKEYHNNLKGIDYYVFAHFELN